MDHSTLTMRNTICNFMDLKSCYDQQLAKVRSIVKESTGRNRKAIILFTKIMPEFKQCINTGFGLSSEYYRERENMLAGTGQGNKFSSDMCRDVSCLIIKQLEKENLSVIFKALENQQIEQCVSVSFADDTDFITEENEYDRKMQEIINKYYHLWKATGGQIETNKTKYFAWKWRWR